MKGKTLVLNKYYFPVNTVDWRKAVEKICAGRMVPLDIQYSEDQDGDSLESYEWIRAVTGSEGKRVKGRVITPWDEWVELPVRPFDESIATSKGRVRAPSIVLCVEYTQVKWHKVLFPTKQNIWARDGNTCGYTGRKLTKDELSVDHIVPRSKGGQDTWENLVTCAKDINCLKADKDLKDFHLKLKIKPTKPKHSVSFPILRPEWTKMIAEAC